MVIRFKKYQIEALKSAYEESKHLTKEKKIELARITGLDMEQIASWFNRKRARERVRESKGDLERINAELKRSLQECQEREVNLQKELRESKKREYELVYETQHLKRRLTILDSDSQFDSVIRFVNGYP